MASPPRYVAWTSSVNDDDYFLSRASDLSRFSDGDNAQRPPHRASKKKMAIATTVSFMAVMALVLCVVLPQRGNNSKNSGPISSLATTSASTKSDALNERMNALDYMEKKRQENFPKKTKTSLRSSSIVTQGRGIQLDATKEDLSYAIANLSIVDVAVLEEEESKKTEDASKSNALEKRVDALGYMDKKRQEEHPNKQTSLRSSSTIVQGQLDPLFAKEDLEYSSINVEDDDDEEEGEEDVMVNPAADQAMEENIAEHMDALAYVETKRHEDHPQKKSSVRSSSIVTKGQQLDPLFAKEELVEYDNAVDDPDETEQDDMEDTGVVVEHSSVAVDEPVVLDEQMDALAYMDKKRQDEHPKKTSVRSSSVVTKSQLDPLFAKEELETAMTDEDLTNHVDALDYMDKKRQIEHPKKTSVRASATVTKGQLDPLLVKEELETTASEETVEDLTNHVDALAYMDKKRQEEHPKKTSVRASSTVTKGQLDPLLAKEELDITASEATVDELTNHVDALAYMDKKRQNEHPKKTSFRASATVTKGQLDPLLAKEELETAVTEETIEDLTDHVDALTYMDKKRHDGHPKKTSVRSSSMVTKGQLDPLFPKEELGTGGSEQTGFDMISVIPDSMTAGSSTGSTTERRQNRELVDSNNESRASSAEDDDASSIVEDDDKAIGAPEETSGRVTEEFLMSHTWTQADFKVVGDFSTNHDETLEMNQGE